MGHAIDYNILVKKYCFQKSIKYKHFNCYTTLITIIQAYYNTEIKLFTKEGFVNDGRHGIFIVYVHMYNNMCMYMFM